VLLVEGFAAGAPSGRARGLAAGEREQQVGRVREAPPGWGVVQAVAGSRLLVLLLLLLLANEGSRRAHRVVVGGRSQAVWLVVVDGPEFWS